MIRLHSDWLRQPYMSLVSAITAHLLLRGDNGSSVPAKR